MAVKDWRKYLKFRCTGCGNCCRDTVVCITDEDVRRITQGTGKSPLDFVRFYTEKEVSMDQRDPLWVRFGKSKAIMALRWKNDQCIFLDKDNRCTIYEHRPVTCRDHPFNTTLSETGAVEKILLSRVVKCPHEWDGHVTRRSLKTVQRWNERQEEAYCAKVREWNRRPHSRPTRPAFLRYLGLLPSGPKKG